MGGAVYWISVTRVDGRFQFARLLSDARTLHASSSTAQVIFEFGALAFTALGLGWRWQGGSAMAEPISIRELHIARATSLEIDFSTGQSIAMVLPPKLGLGITRTFVNDLNSVLQAALAVGGDPRGR
jgi:hypothetical protein